MTIRNGIVQGLLGPLISRFGGGDSFWAFTGSLESWMKKFLAIYIGSLAARGKAARQTAEEDKLREQRGMEAWGAWVTANSGAIVDTGSPIGKTKRASPAGITDIHNHITAYTIVQAASLEEAAKMFQGHPHFTIFPGDSVEIMECLPMPEIGR